MLEVANYIFTRRLDGFKMFQNLMKVMKLPLYELCEYKFKMLTEYKECKLVYYRLLTTNYPNSHLHPYS